MASFSSKVTGWLINLAALFTPGLAGRLAFDLFCATGSREPGSDKERAAFNVAQSKMAEAQLVRLIIVGGEVACWKFLPTGRPSGQTILVIHGWASRVDYLQTLITALRDTGAVVIGLDLPGHGKSSGRRLTVPMAVDAIDAANRQFGPFDATIGHSFGGFVAVMAAGGAMPDVPASRPDRMVLVAAPSSPETPVEQFADFLGLSTRARKAMDTHAKRLTGQQMAWFSGPRMLSAVNIDTLVIHAEDDKEVSADAARAYSDAGPHVSLQWADGLGHRRIISSSDVIGSIISFVENRPQSLARIA